MKSPAVKTRHRNPFYVKTLFGRISLAFVLSYFIFYIVIFLFLGAGYKESGKKWNQKKQEELESFALQILTVPLTDMEQTAAPATPFYVYDAQKNLVFSARGPGQGQAAQPGQAGQPRNGAPQRGLSGGAETSPGSGLRENPISERQRRNEASAAQLTPLYRDKILIGYYSGNSRFNEDPANLLFLGTMKNFLAWAAIVSVLLSVCLALMLSRGLSLPSKTLASGIINLSLGNYSAVIEESGTEEIKGIARAAKSLKTQLLREKELRSQWAQDLAHDLRTPISALTAQLEALSEGVLTATPERLNRILQELSGINLLITDLEELMKLESPEVRPIIETLEGDYFISQMESRFSAEFLKKGLEFKTENSAPPFPGDRRLLDRAFTNILSNAVRHADTGGRVIFEISRGSGTDAGSIIFKISNPGPPITEEEQTKVFDRLYRGDFARNSPGSGLGLTIAKKIIELHGGIITIESGGGRTTVKTVLTRSLPGGNLI